MKSSFVFLVAVSSVIGLGTALDCYFCQDDNNCADPFNSTGATIQPCTNGDKCAASQDRNTGVFNRLCMGADSSVCSRPGCNSGTSGADDKGSCYYCCDDQDLCNNRSVADEVAGIHHCYTCFYSTDPSSPGSVACNSPFDPDGDGVTVGPCDGECGVTRNTFAGNVLVSRRCYATAEGEQCEAGCEGTSCTTCCSGNLCNRDSDSTGTSPVPPPTSPVQPPTAPSLPPSTPDPNGVPTPTTSQGVTPGKGLAAILSLSVALYVALL